MISQRAVAARDITQSRYSCYARNLILYISIVKRFLVIKQKNITWFLIHLLVFVKEIFENRLWSYCSELLFPICWRKSYLQNRLSQGNGNIQSIGMGNFLFFYLTFLSVISALNDILNCYHSNMFLLSNISGTILVDNVPYNLCY